MAGYEDTKRMIIDTLMGRDPGTEIMPENHQAFALNMLDYIRSVEMSSASTLIGIAEGDTTPIQPDNARVTYIAGVAQERTVTFVNFHDINGQPISITTGEMEAVFVILLWNTAYWEYQITNANIISAAENANFRYYLNMRKTYASVAAMNADVDSHIADDGTPIRVGETVAVHNTSNPSENAIYSLRVTSNGVYYWQEQATLPALDISGMFNQVNANVNYLECYQNAEDEIKIISDIYFSLSTHVRLLVKMINTNTHPTPKLNINGTGAKSIWYNGAVATDVNTWDAGEFLDIYYDGTNYQAISVLKIDDTKLANPANNALPKAIDVMGLAAKLEGVTASETKVTVVTSGDGANVTEGYKILGNTGLLSQQAAYNCLEIPTGNYKRIRFLGIVLRSGLSSSDKNSGYAFGHYVDNSWVTDFVFNYDINTENTNLVKEYIIDVPTGSTHFRCASKFGSVMTQNMFYCYFVNGVTVIEAMVGKTSSIYKTEDASPNLYWGLTTQTSNDDDVAIRKTNSVFSKSIRISDESLIILKANANNDCYITFLKRFIEGDSPKTLGTLKTEGYLCANMTVNGTTYNSLSITKDKFAVYPIPNDCVQILIGNYIYGSSSFNRTPTKLVVVKQTQLIGEIKKEIAEYEPFYGKRTYNLVGLGATGLGRNEINIKLQKGCVYRVHKPVGMTNVTFDDNFKTYIFGWIRVLNGATASQNGVAVSNITLMPDYFDLIAEENDYYTIFCRADYGNEFDVTIEQIDPVGNDIVLTMDAKVGGFVVASDGTWTENSQSANCVFKSKRPTMGKKCLKLTWPILLYSAKDLDRGLAWYDENGNYIGGIKLGDINVSGNDSNGAQGQRESVPVIIAIPDRARFFNYTYWFGSSFTEYPQLQKIGDVVLTDNDENTIPLISGNFGDFIDFLDYDGPTGDTLMLQSYSTLVQQWDAVQSAHSEVITSKQLLGYGTAAGEGDAVADTNLPIYEYVVHPIPHNDTGYEEYDTTIPNNVVKVLIVTGVHGAEKPASTAVLELVKHLVGHYSSSKYNDAIVSLAQNCEFHIIPCVNPRGYDVMYNSSITPSSRDNARGVNINRNFGHNWAYQVGGDVAAKGTAPYSELETQILRDWIAANKDAFIYIDAHTTYLGNSPLQGCYNYAFDMTSKCLLNAFMKQVSVYAQRQWPTIFTENQYIGFLGFNNQACTASEARYVANIPRVATLEVNNNAGGLGRGNEEQIVLALNQIINYIRMCIDNSEKKNIKM